ncbi:MAG: DUF2804 domain-containing protein [Clostridia bacterium]
MQQQNEIKEVTKLLNDDGTLAVAGWARHNLFTYDRRITKPRSRLKEWDFYQISDGHYMVQISFFNITLASAASACILDLTTGKMIATTAKIMLGTRRRYILPKKGDVSNFFRFEKGKTVLQFDTRKTVRKLDFKGKVKGKDFDLHFEMDIPDGHENITIVTPFKDMPTRFFMTTKQNCMPTSGTVKFGEKEFKFDKENTFSVLDWGRGVWPHKNFWYWGNGATRIDGKIFGFEITWGIGNEENATETCLFYDGIAHKIGVVDVEHHPKDRWMEPWHFTSDDGRFDVTMTPTFDNKNGIIVCDLGMLTHQVHGLWNGYAILDDGKRIEIKDMYAFCEFVENRW